MCVRRFLPLGIRAVAGTTRDEVGGLAELAIFQNREDRNTVPDIIGDQYVPAGLVDDDVAGRGSTRTDLIQKGQPSSRAIHRERTHATGRATVVVFRLVDGIQKSSI